MAKRPFVLNDGQRDGARIVYTTPITVLYGDAGTGKTGLAMHIGMKMLKDKDIERIILTRPAVSTEEYGFLPGEIEDKFEVPYLAPLIDFLNNFSDNATKKAEKKPKLEEVAPLTAYEQMKAKGQVEIQPLAFMRGKTFDNALIIFDEIQNATPQQMKMAITRIGQGSRVILCGDLDQCDLSPYKVPVNGLDAALQLSNHTKHVEAVHLTVCERSPIISDLLEAWKLVQVR